MSIYDQIAQGVQPPGRNLLGVAGLLENQRRYRESAKLRADELKFERERLQASDLKAFKKEQLEQSLARIEWALGSESPRAALLSDPQAVENFGKQGIDLNETTDEQAVEMLTMARSRIAAQLGVRPPAPEKPGAPVKVKGPKGEAIYEDPRAAIGREAYEAPDQEARGTWGQPFEATDPETGERGLFQSHSLTGAIRPAQVGARQLGPKPDKGGDSVTAENAIFRQAAALFGGAVHPVSGEISILENDRPRVQAVARRASELQAEGKSIAAAVEQAFGERPWLRRPAPKAAQQYAEGTVIRNPETGERRVLRGGQWVPVQ